jgi:hypothetical protein
MKTKYHVPWYRKGWLRLRTWRCPDAGIEYLIWASGLKLDEHMGCDKDSPNFGKPTHQAIAAQEILDLYRWWTVTYRNRVDPYEASGWSAHCEAMRVKYPGSMFSSLNSKDPADRKASDRAHKLLQKMEADYEKEDEAMMIRLIKIRDALWT